MGPRIDVRFGLVMYGGVSLAIYIHGVSREFFEACRDTGLYKLLGALTDSHVGVDIVSGTSAGGINGIFLAYALTQNKEFGEMATLWRNLGDISRLLRPVPEKGEECPSLLAGETFYHESLLTAFKTMGVANPPVPRVQELDLFVTGTDVHGNLYTTTDDSGHVIDIKDHRTVFVLKHRRGRKEPFNAQDPAIYASPDTAFQALSKLARITSCFPAAFAPVPVSFNGTPAPNSIHTNEDEYLQEWGTVEKASYFQDGGILDNKPFSYTVQEIFGRHANSEVERVLCYVEPDPEKFDPNAKVEEPTFLEAVFSGTYGTTSYESIADDLESIRQHNTQIDRYKRLSEKLRDNIKLKSGADEIVPTNADDPCVLLCLRARVGMLMDRVIEGVLKKHGRHRSLLVEEEKKNVGKLVVSFRDFSGQEPAILRSFDVYFRLRRLYATVYRIYEECYGGAPSVESSATTAAGELASMELSMWEERIRALESSMPAPDEEMEAYRFLARSVWDNLNRQIKLLEIVRYWMESIVDNMEFELHKPLDPNEVWQSVAGTLEHLLNLDANGNLGECSLDGPLDQDHLDKIHAEFRKRAAVLKGPPKEPRIPDFNGLLSKIDKLGSVQTAKETRVAKPAFENFVALDCKLFPMEWMAGIEQKDVIRTHRISPADACRGFSNLDLKSKMAGDQLGHFSGFFKRSWRSNDILWGRLDGLCQITEILLAKERLQRILGQPHRRKNILANVAALDLHQLFPNSSAQAIGKVRAWILNLLSSNPAVVQQATSGSQYTEAVELLVEMGQLEILRKELPTVVADAAVQEASWNRTRVTIPPDANELASVTAALAKNPYPNAYQAAREFSTEMAKLVGDDARTIREKYQGSSIAPKYTPTDADLTKAIMEGIEVARGTGGFGRLQWIHAQGPVDKFLTTVSSEYRAKAQFDALAVVPSMGSPKDSNLGRFFRMEYQVGSENVMQDIPGLVLFEIACQALLLILSSLIGSLKPAWRTRAEENWFYRWVLRLPLQVGLGIARNVREDPAKTVALKSAVTAVMLAALVVGIYYWNPLVFNSDKDGLHFTLKWLVLLFVVPTIGIYTLWLRRLPRLVSWLPVGAGLLFGSFFLYTMLSSQPSYNGFHAEGIALEFVKTDADLNAFRANPGDAMATPEVISKEKKNLDTDTNVIIPGYSFIFVVFAVWAFAIGKGKGRVFGLIVLLLTLVASYADNAENGHIMNLLTSMTAGNAFKVLVASETKWISIFVMVGLLGIAALAQGKRLPAPVRWMSGLVSLLTAGGGIALALLRVPQVEIALVLLGLSLVLLGRCMYTTAEN